MAYLGKREDREMFYGAKAELFDLALKMRRNPTQAEKCLWKYLKKFRKEGFPFRRQHPISFFISDFYCHQVNNHNKERDDNRSAEFEKFGITTIRFTNDQILNNLDFVIEEIKVQINRLSSINGASPQPVSHGLSSVWEASPQPLSQGRGAEFQLGREI